MRRNKIEMTKVKKNNSYDKFEQLDGTHSLKDAVFGAYVEYKARKRKGGKLSYFNFGLAKEMGLVPQNHDIRVTKELENKILDTFSIIIINEYDVINKIKYPEKEIKPNMYMATRYLQLQHPGSVGMTSGDGRSIWNGEVKHNGVVWDVSSVGTGATCLSPATHKYNKFFENGDPSISYGCGYSEIDEGISTAFFSEVLHRNSIPSERVLAVIEFEKGFSITVRAYPNLLRPSHFFNHLKQSQWERLRDITHYYMNKQVSNGAWKDFPNNFSEQLDYFMDKMIEKFAFITAKFEDEYIFCWMDWDGDNILMDGGIIDYGSIRQFGLFHHEYRYDDVERYSTTIKEQKTKCRHIIQTFAQMIDYLKTRKKKPLNHFKNNKALKKFDQKYEYNKDFNLLYKMGFEEKNIKKVIDNKKIRKHTQDFRNVFSYFERMKSKRGQYETADGINWDAVFCMRDILRELPQMILIRGDKIEADEFIEIIKSNYASDEDIRLTSSKKSQINKYQDLYLSLVNEISKLINVKKESLLLNMTMRSSVINKYDRVTGDSISYITDKVLKAKPKLTPEQIYEILEEFTHYQNLDPTKQKSKTNLTTREKTILKSFFRIVKECREGI